ncbi:amidohydrolase/deacetylase family metallohydrolase [Acidihalobacter prosperus]|uniref:Dihydroorotase n=1 Tax=Acidihalobacter prosperus TaxID=160660 RepID=A0A1A6C6N5_9GAMM|nr:amidohydrolase/deacetylase family metallohydrolase [Acidihalobacter prosperus]OBS10222.1 dihydroorotase [Acidihalobacter prosperus]
MNQTSTDDYDLILRGGRVIDTASGFDAVADLAIRDGRIAALAPHLEATPGARVIDVGGKLVTAGLIDTHAHVFQHVTGRFGLNPDLCGVRSGVTTLVDQGGPSLMTLPAFRHYVSEPADSSVLCFLSAYLVGGLEGHHYAQLYGPEMVDVKRTIKIGRENRDLVKGIKAHAEIGGKSRWGMDVIKQAAEIAVGIDVPLYIHLGQLWPEREKGVVDPDSVIEELVPIMRPGDVLAHPFTRHPGGFISTRTGEVHPIVEAALAQGIRVDVGHGSHFSFEMAEKVLAHGIRPYTLGADMHGYNTYAGEDGADDRESNPFYGAQRFCLTLAMSELLALGMPLHDVVATVTQNAAALLGLSDEIGSLQPGLRADVSVLDLAEGEFRLRDNGGAEATAAALFVPALTLKDGRPIEVDSPVVVRPEHLH